ncbi:hypothetical protein C0Q70_07285 [Pomacea canaliculata]|uniref:Uncharacterized protein n=2 Tax=Pomacea canaliculata TaxID=400727 RepID=A0A2T7PEM1_POMCA|nr:hypothetical protein C0Q70_07285 [Pomacea canaliculata]
MTYYHKDAMKPNGIIATITRPPPVSPPPKTPKSIPRPVTARSARDPPSTELFPSMPWKVPDQADSDND